MSSSGSRKPRPYHGNLEKQTEKNRYYRQVIHTNRRQQLVLMYLRPGEEIGSEVHPNTSQFIRIESGSGRITLGDRTFRVRDGFAVVVPPRTKHNVVAGKDGMRLYTVYSPPEHPPKTRQTRKP